MKFAEGQTPPELYPPHRVTAALGLLKKVMPDMTEAMVKGDPDNPIIHAIERRIVRSDD